jgi:GT2 family glycosyltransferase
MPDELIIVDSSDDTAIKDFMITNNFPFKGHYFHAGPGLTHARNIGIQKSSGDILFFFDDDVELEPNYIFYVEKIFKNDEKAEIGAVGGRILNDTPKKITTPYLFVKRKVFNAIRYIFLLSKLGNGRFRFSGMPTQPHALNVSGYIECLSGGCMAFRSEVFEKVHFDENLIGYGHVEDADISKQVLTAGYKIYYEALAALNHYPSLQDRPDAKKLAELTVINYAYFFRKHWPQTWLRKVSFWWTLAGLCLVFLPGAGWQGVLGGIKKISH